MNRVCFECPLEMSEPSSGGFEPLAIHAQDTGHSTTGAVQQVVPMVFFYLGVFLVLLLCLDGLLLLLVLLLDLAAGLDVAHEACEARGHPRATWLLLLLLLVLLLLLLNNQYTTLSLSGDENISITYLLLVASVALAHTTLSLLIHLLSSLLAIAP